MSGGHESEWPGHRGALAARPGLPGAKGVVRKHPFFIFYL